MPFYIAPMESTDVVKTIQSGESFKRLGER
jgi:hypothetical protein